jgi:hypothetical protein
VTPLSGLPPLVEPLSGVVTWGTVGVGRLSFGPAPTDDPTLPAVPVTDERFGDEGGRTDPEPDVAGSCGFGTAWSSDWGEGAEGRLEPV